MWHAGHGAAKAFQERSEPHGERTEERLHLHTREDDEGFYLEITATVSEGRG